MLHHPPTPCRSGPARGCLVVLALTCSVGAWAQEGSNGQLQVSGFMSLVDGRVINGRFDPGYSGSTSLANVNCPCLITDWTNAGVYGNQYSMQPDSHIGIQLNYTVNPDTHLVGQVVARGTDGTPDLSWAYLSYRVNSQWEVQLGRKRIPQFFYSDFQDVGVAIPWISVPPELYGWEVTNFNGGQLRYSNQWRGANYTASIYGGDAVLPHAPMYAMYGIDKTASWKNMVGTDFEITTSALTLRSDYTTATTDDMKYFKSYSLASILDMDRWFVVGEITGYTRTDTQGNGYSGPARTIGAGLRMGAWTPFLNYAQYVESDGQLYHRESATLRYDFNPRSDVKLQLDFNQDLTNNFTGTVTVVRLAYDHVF